MREDLRTWGPVVVVVALLPAAFIALRTCLPSIGGEPRTLSEPRGETSRSATCAECHPDATGKWLKSVHAVAEVTVDPGSTAAAPLEGGQIVAEDRNGISQPFRPVRTIGIDPLWQYLVLFDDGRLQVTQAAWDPARREWFEVFDDAREAGEWGHWTGGGMTWNSQCASCHSTGVSKGYDATSDTYATTVSEHGVGCEACHGDATPHLTGGPAPAVPDERWMDVCASCHALRAELTGAFVPGEAFLDHFAPMVVDTTDRTHPDGQIRAEAFEFTAFVATPKFASGMRCTNCHDPHSGQLVRSGDELCVACHTAMPSFEPHDGHRTQLHPPEEVSCVGCHMPTTVYMQRDPRHDHGFPIPDPGAVAGAPDGCTHCHTDRDVAWAERATVRWYGPRSLAQRVRGLLTTQARAGDRAAIGGLQRLLASDAPVGWRAAAAANLTPFTADEDVRASLVRALSSPSDLVRFAAAGSLGSAAGDPAVSNALSSALSDPVRAVRVQAARGQVGQRSHTDASMADYAVYLAYNADQPAALQELGSWQLQQGRTTAATHSLRRAVTFDPTSAAHRDTLAVALSMAGDAPGAMSQLRKATQLRPDDAELWMRLALAEAGAGEPEAAARSLDNAVTLQPTLARAWYNLGLLLVQQGDVEAGLRALTRATQEASSDVELAYGLAATLWEHGDRSQATAAAERVLALQPGHPGAARIVELAAP